MSKVFEKYNYDIEYKLSNFEKYVPVRDISRFMARYELFKLIKDVKGSIIECGVHRGGGVMAWAKMSSALEPYSLNRKIIGFDTFAGFSEINNEDLIKNDKVVNNELKAGGWSAEEVIYDEMQDCILEYNAGRLFGNKSKIELVKGDAVETIPKYLNYNQHLVVSLLFLDFDLYEPTKVALESFVPRMPRGGVIVFDQINNPVWPGETVAMMEYFGGLNKLDIRKMDFECNIAFLVI
jgi:Macrocin-O-methyltransferase (TylF)